MIPPEIDLATTKEVGELLQNARKSKGLSRPDVAKLISISRNRLMQVEQGYIKRYGDSEEKPTRLDRDQLLELCELLEIPPDVADRILKLSGYKPLDRSREIVYLHGLSPKAREHVQALAEKYRAGNQGR